MNLSVAVLIPSWKRPEALSRCLRALAEQERKPDRVVVVWQGTDNATRDAAETLRPDLPFKLDILHVQKPGIVPAENAALGYTNEDVIALIDDDAVAPQDWLSRHLAHYTDPAVGAVGGPADNFNSDGTRFPIRDREPVGEFTLWGTLHGNMYDQLPEWRQRPPRDVTHLVGYNLSLRRTAFDRFEERLRNYWQLFELEVCLQVRGRGFRVVFDFANVVHHYPTNLVFAGGRDGDLRVKVYNPTYNHGFVVGKHSKRIWWPVIVTRQLLIGRVDSPGMLASLVAIRRFGQPCREFGVLARATRAFISGWWDGWSARTLKPLSHTQC